MSRKPKNMYSSKENRDLFDNVQDLRKRLMHTEKTLHSLNSEADTRPYTGISGPVTPERQKETSMKLEDLAIREESFHHHGQMTSRSDEGRPLSFPTQQQTAAERPTSSQGSYRQRPATFGSVQYNHPVQPNTASYHRQQQHDPLPAGQSLQQFIPSQQHKQQQQPSIPQSMQLSQPFMSYSNSAEAQFDQQQRNSRNIGDSGHSKQGESLSSRSVPAGVDSALDDMSYGQRSDYDMMSLRRKIQSLREENAQLVSQNHKMLNQLEDLGLDRHSTRDQNENLKQELTRHRDRTVELEEQVTCLRSENHAHERALRESEERAEDYQRDTRDLEGVLDEYKTQIHSLEEQLQDSVATLSRVEVERDQTLQAAEAIQQSYEEYQRKSKDKIQKLESGETHVGEKLEYLEQEREQLLRDAEMYKTNNRELMEQIRRSKEDIRIEEESRLEVEQHNLQMRADLVLAHQKNAQLEQNLQYYESLKHDNEELRRSVSEYKRQLVACQSQIGESHAELVRLEEMARALQGKSQSDAAKKKQAAATESTDLDGSYLETLDQDAQIAELRAQLADKEDEVEQLKSALEKSRHDSSGFGSSDVRKDLQLVQDRNKQAELRIEELEALLLRYEEEKSGQQEKVTKLEEELSDLRINCSSLESKITHRNSQVSDMQKELNEKLQEITGLEREVRKKTSQISSLERQLDHKVSEVSEQVSKVNDLEEEIHTKQLQMQQVKKNLEEKNGELIKMKSMSDKMKSVHIEQCQELQKQNDVLEERVQKKVAAVKEQSKRIQCVENELALRESALNEAITNAQMEIQRKSMQNDTTLQAFEKKAQEATNRVKQVESALTMCKEELSVYMAQYQETNTRHQLEISDRDKEVDKLKREVLNLKQSLQDKDKLVVELEGNLSQRLDMVQQSTSRVSELEDAQSAMERQICQLEQQLHLERSKVEREKLSVQTEVKGAEKKLQQACLEVEQRNLEIQRLKSAISNLESKKKKVPTATLR